MPIRRLQRPLLVLACLGLGACATTPRLPHEGHIAAPPVAPGTIPAPLASTPPLPPPQPVRQQAVYTAVGIDLPVREFLFSLARDAGLNLDIYPEVSGKVTINAVDEPLDSILARVARQAGIRFSRRGKTLIAQPDTPYLQTYHVDYVNLSRDNSSTVSVATQIATTGGAGVGEQSGAATGGSGNNNSTTRVTSTSNQRFWQTLERNIHAILGETVASGKNAVSTPSVIVNAETGLITVKATSAQHKRIGAYLQQVLTNARRQVLIEATVVEVTLNDQYQLGVDWSRLAGSSGGLSLNQSLLGNKLVNPPFTLLSYADPKAGLGNISATVKALRQFGDVRVLSSPKIMAINNQTALLKVVDNLVYFTLESDTTTSANGPAVTTFTSEVHTVPVGFVMSVTPQISDSGQIILDVRPTISRVIGFVNDPNPSLSAAKTESRIPQIQVREMDSVLRLDSGRVAVLGGLIQDTVDLDHKGVPLLSRVPRIGDAFKYRDDTVKKTELVIFLRPRVIRNASIARDLADFRHYLAPARRRTGPEEGGS